MAKEVIMPRFGMTQEEADIVRWLCSEGDRVEQGDPICEVTTDKVNMEVEAPVDGILTGIQFHEGDTVPVTQIIAYIASEAEYNDPSFKPAAPAGASPVAPPQPQAQTPQQQPAAPPPPVSATPLAQRIAAAEGLPLEGVQGSGARGRITRDDIQRALNSRETTAAPQSAPAGKVPAAPAARALARQFGVELEHVTGSGPQGRVQGWDVREYQQRHEAAPATAPRAASAPTPAVQPGGVEIIPLEGMRRTIAGRLQASYQQAPHIFLSMDIDMGRAISLREALNPRGPDGREPVSLTALIVKAVALALREQPLLNSHFVDDRIHRYDAVNIGMAVALEQGLIVPVIPNADQAGINQLGDLVADLSLRARQGKLRPEDVSGGTFTISNLGMFGVDHFTAILNPPQVGILAVGRVARRFVPDENDQPVARSLMTVTLSADHRVIDGSVAARFLAALKQRLESPNLLLE